MSTRTAATILAWSAWVFSLALTAFGLLLLALNLSHPNVHLFDYWAEDTVIAVSSSTVGAVVASRRPANSIGWIFCAIGLVGGVDHFSAQYATYALLTAPGALSGGEAFVWIRSWIWVFHLGLFLFLGLLFPDGLLPSSRRWRWFASLGAVVTLLGAISVSFSPGPVDGLGLVQNPLGIEGADSVIRPVEALLFALLLVAAASLFSRLRLARGIERQQLKWFAYAAAVASSGGALTYTISRATSAPWVWWAGFMLLIGGLIGLPVAVGFAVLRYRLYDIDLIINRTFIYGVLMVALALVYFGSTAALEYAFRALTGQGSQLAVVASTLAIAVLFSPLKRRIRASIDRRFYRKNYDAARTLEAFNARLRDELDLEELTDDLVGVVRETLEPAHVSLWLRPPKNDN